MELHRATIQELLELLRNKQVSAQEITDHFVARCKKYNMQLGALLEVFDDIEISSDDHGDLSGIPGVIKDNIAQKGRRLTCASKILKNYVSPYDATATKRLRGAGATLLGRANMDEFAMGSSNETSVFYPARNPWNTDRVAGGSSGGSAVAVAAGLVPWALGSETGGSVRQPAAFCGLVGLKPTYGRISRSGLVAYGSSLDQIGIFTRTVHDAAAVLGVIAGHDERDSTTLSESGIDYVGALQSPQDEKLTIGVVKNALHAPGMDSQVQAAIEQAIQVLESTGVMIKPIEIPSLDYAAAAYFILSRAEAASNLARFDGVRYGVRAADVQTLEQLYKCSRREGFGLEVRTRIMVGNYVLSAGHADQFYQRAVEVRAWIARELQRVFDDVHAIVLPVSPDSAFKLGAFASDTLKMDLQDYFTCPANLAGIPALSLPCGFNSENMPIGFQIMTPSSTEERLLRLGHRYQSVTDWHTRFPGQFV